MLFGSFFWGGESATGSSNQQIIPYHIHHEASTYVGMHKLIWGRRLWVWTSQVLTCHKDVLHNTDDVIKQYKASNWNRRMCSRLSHITHSSRFYLALNSTRCCFNSFSFFTDANVDTNPSESTDTWVNPLWSFVAVAMDESTYNFLSGWHAQNALTMWRWDVFCILFKVFMDVLSCLFLARKAYNIEQGLMKGGRRLFRSSNKIFSFVVASHDMGNKYLRDSI